MVPIRELAGIVKGEVLQEGSDRVIDNLLLDSRRVAHTPSSLFIPLVTARRDAHQFIPAVYASGVRAFLVSVRMDTSAFQDAWFIRVENTLQALQQLAAWHRSRFGLPVVGITGSNGKTVVKEWLNQLLEADYRIVRSPKSYNSQIGVPLSVWLLGPEHNLALFEAGISQADEMGNLEKMIRPDIGIFTNIGETHNAGFLNMRHKINEKLQLFRHTAFLIYNKDYYELHDCVLQFAAQVRNSTGREIRLLNWSRRNEALLQILSADKEAGHTQLQALYEGETLSLSVPFVDDASVEDAVHCWMLMLHLKVPMPVIAERMQRLTPVAMRLELMKGMNNCTLINDSYNNDVSSFAIALDLLAQQNQHESRTVILSDILQSGRDNDVYEEVAELLRDRRVNRFIGIGDSLARNKKIFRSISRLNSTFFKTTEEFLQALDSTSFHDECILIKGARKFGFEKIAKRLEERIHQTVMEINLQALTHNMRVYQSLLQPGVKMMAMVKAFSYGSGSLEVANRLQFEGVDYLAVAFADEGILLRKNRIDRPIMVMNPDENSYDMMVEWGLEPEIFNLRTLQRMLEAAQFAGVHHYPVHLKLDTGMHRLGFEEDMIDALVAILKGQQELRVASVFSHLSGSEEKELDDFTRHQATLFRRMAQRLEKELGYGFLRHLCNSSGIARHPDLHFDMVRLGLGLYGVDGSGELQGRLQHVSRLRTAISQIKRVSRNETVGYNRKGVLDRDTVIGTVCIGYADGIPRRLGNGIGHMLVHGRPAPIVGNVCMDMCMLDVTDIPEAREGDTVIVFDERQTVSDLARWAGTIPYEILTGISQRVKRVYFEE